tara:strand:- start:45 stop:302 length:258 start_codon:yes stop_codon:yes gene_type:complete
MAWFVYILKCGDDTLYTGITTDIPRRLSVHESGKGAKYTKGRGPLALVYQEECSNRSMASKREIEIKALPRSDKEILINAELLSL